MLLVKVLMCPYADVSEVVLLRNSKQQLNV